MTNEGSAPKKCRLHDWEQHLAPQVRQVEFLGEITVTVEEWQQLGQTQALPSQVTLVGFKWTWADKNYRLIVQIAQRLPDSVLQEDSGWLMYYDNALMRAEKESKQLSF